ncbi:MAG: acyltransferase family protein [Lachnospiraceae bacterium]|nr:acyltransferase family protein [Lachnospiraceae bacterium]
MRAFRALVDATAWSVPVFLMISGYLFLQTEKQITWKDAILKYCRRIALALVIFGIPFALLELVGTARSFSVYMIPKAVASVCMGRGWAHMWYLYLILILYAVTPLLKWFLGRVPMAVTYALLGFLALGAGVAPFFEVLFGSPYLIALPSAAIYLFYYLCGYAFAERKREPGRAEGWVSLGLFAVMIAGQMASRMLGLAMEQAYGYLPTVISALLLFNAGWAFEGTGAQKKHGKTLAICLWLSPLCFGIYLIHPVFLNLFYKFLHLSIMNFRFYVGVPLFFLIAFGGAVIGTWVMRLIPPLRKYVL